MDELSRLVTNARRLVREGYYRVADRANPAPSFLGFLEAPDRPADVIAEIKFASPSGGLVRETLDFEDILARMVATKPLGLSILAEPRIFGGSLDFVRSASRHGLPVLMKDIVVDPAQVEAAASSGASAVLVIQTLFSRGLLEGSSQDLIDAAHDEDLEVVLEVHTVREWDEAIRTDADILGINNRDLSTMEVDLRTTANLLSSRTKDRPVIAMSGIERRDQVEALLAAGADAVLVGTSIMTAPDPARRLRELLDG